MVQSFIGKQNVVIRLPGHINKLTFNYAVSGLKNNNPHLKELIRLRRTDLTEHTDYTDKKFQNLSSAGPIPSGNYFLNLSSNMHYEKTGGGWGIGGWSIYPTNPIIRRAGFIEMKLGWDLPWVRSGFFLHEDGNRDGTAGCIGLSMRGIRDLKAHLQVYYAKTKAATMLIVVDYEA